MAKIELNVVNLRLLASMNGLAHFVCGSNALEVVRISDAHPFATYHQIWQAFANALLAAVFRNGKIKEQNLGIAFGAPASANCMLGLRTSLVELSLSVPQSNTSFLTHDTQLVAEAISSLDSLEELNFFLQRRCESSELSGSVSC